VGGPICRRIARARADGEANVRKNAKLEGDVNGDGVVSILDALLVLNQTRRNQR
jgi:hypothetical protein